MGQAARSLRNKEKTILLADERRDRPSQTDIPCAEVKGQALLGKWTMDNSGLVKSSDVEIEW